MKNLSAIEVNEIEAADILKIPVSEPELLFQPDKEHVKHRFQQLAMLWDPDRHPGNPQANEVTDRLNALRECADVKLQEGMWRAPNEIKFSDVKTGHRHTIKYVRKHELKLGEVYVSKSFVTFAVKKEFSELFDGATRTIAGLPIANDRMKQECQRFLDVQAAIEAADRNVIVVRKSPGMIVRKSWR